MTKKIHNLGPAFCFVLLLAGCGGMSPEDFAAGQPAFKPEEFFTGHTKSWGVFEDRGGAPTNEFQSDAQGNRDPDGALVLTQNFTFANGEAQQRVWHFTKIDAHHYEGTAGDVLGVAQGEAYGNLFHWTYTLALEPGNSVKNVNLEQWMYLQADGQTMVNRAVIRKLGVEVAQVTEYFRRLPE